MYSKKEVLVITTETPTEGRIKKQLEPVTAHVVAGTNLFNDFFAGMSDIFGGRSGSYKKQLSSIYSEAIERIKQEARRLGGNGVVGLKIDIDEISGGGKSMFMITAIGTAVIIEYENKKNSDGKEPVKRTGYISNDEIQHLKKKKMLIQKVQEDEKFSFTEDVWEFIISNRVKEFSPFIFNRVCKILLTPTHFTPESIVAFKNHTKLFISNLDIEDQKNLIYNELEKEDLNSLLREFLHGIIQQQYLMDYNRVKELLNSESLEVQKSGLIISTFDIESYSSDDEKQQLQLIAEVEKVFQKRGEITTKKGVLSSKEKPAWKCECGKLNSEEITYCTKCQKDIFGFTDQELKPQLAIRRIKQKLELLTELQQ